VLLLQLNHDSDTIHPSSLPVVVVVGVKAYLLSVLFGRTMMLMMTVMMMEEKKNK